MLRSAFFGWPTIAVYSRNAKVRDDCCERVYHQRIDAVNSGWPDIRPRIESDTLRLVPIHSEKHRAPRYPFVAGIQVTDLVTEKQLAAHTEDLSLFGCFVETLAPFPAGTKVRLRISYSGANLISQGTVAYSRNNGGMGIAFTSIEPSSLSILDAWLVDLRK